MKSVLACIVVASVITVSVRAETSTKISDIHLCCQGCVRGAEKAVAKTEGVTANIDQEEGTVTLTGPDTAAVQKATDAKLIVHEPVKTMTAS